MMSKKDFEAIAKAIAELSVSDSERRQLVTKLSMHFALCKRRFNPEKFSRACGV
jgi:hypothetical protein